ncbi:MAG: hypothetical protein QOF48_3148 [Verrucomicrobiota bacterium]|jgi:hypothetical protein
MNTRTSFFRLGLFLFFSSLGAEVMAQHPLDSWVHRILPGSSSNLNSVAYGNGLFVAVGDGSFIARSADGATWTGTTLGNYGTLKRVRFLNGQFLAVGASDKLLVSTDGTNWTTRNLPVANVWDIAWGDGSYVIAAAGTFVSSNAVNWTQIQALTSYPLPSPPGGTGMYATIFDTVVFGNGGFLALPTGPPPPDGFHARSSFFSTNGINWIPGGRALQSSQGSESASELISVNGVWLSTTLDAFLSTSRTGVNSSTNNGGDWCCTFLGDESDTGGRFGAALAFGDGHYLWVQNKPSGHGWNDLTVFTSTNRVAWTLRLQNTNGLSQLANAAAFGNGTFVIVGSNNLGASYILQSGNISGAPSIFQEPQDRGAVAMNPATFSVQAVGAQPLSYQWYKNGTTLTAATNSSFAIASVGTSDTGGYRAIVANSFGSVTSRVAQLTVAFLNIDNYAGIQVLGVPGRTYRIEATPASGMPAWQTITNLTLPSSPYIWIDYDSPGMATRLYRVAELP